MAEAGLRSALAPFVGIAAMVVCGGLAGCQTAPVRYANEGGAAAYGMAVSTGGQLYVGAGRALRQPFHDLNLMQDQIAPVLLRAEGHAYDLAGVNSCNDVLNQVAELDLALGPDVDTPKLHRRRTARGAEFAAGAMLDAAGSAAEHFIPMRSTIKQITGATRYEKHVAHAKLAGETRRAFLKAVGMSHDCSWPAAPLDFKPDHVVDVAAVWIAPTPSPASPAILQAKLAPRPVAPLSGAAATRMVMVSAAEARRPGAPVFIAIRDRLTIPPVAPPVRIATQTWRPPAQVRLIAVSESTSVAAPAPWTSGAGALQAQR